LYIINFIKLRFRVKNETTLISAKNHVDLSSISEVISYITGWPRFFGPPCIWLDAVSTEALYHYAHSTVSYSISVFNIGFFDISRSCRWYMKYRLCTFLLSVGTVVNYGNMEITETVIFVKCHSREPRDLTGMTFFGLQDYFVFNQHKLKFIV